MYRTKSYEAYGDMTNDQLEVEFRNASNADNREAVERIEAELDYRIGASEAQAERNERNFGC